MLRVNQLTGFNKRRGGGAGDPNFSNVSLLIPADSDLNDVSSNGFSATLIGSAAVDTGTQKWGAGSADYTVSGRCISFADDAAIRMGTDDFTIEMWVQPDISGSVKCVYSKGVNGTNDMLFTVSTSEVVFRANGTNDLSATGLSLSTSAFTHIAFEREGSTRRVLIDGSQAATDTLSFNHSSTAVTYIGSVTSVSVPNRYQGHIDDFRITKGLVRYGAGSYTVPTGPFPTS